MKNITLKQFNTSIYPCELSWLDSYAHFLPFKYKSKRCHF